MLRQFADALRVLRPRAAAQAQKAVADLRVADEKLREDLRAVKRAVKTLDEQDTRLARRHEAASAAIERKLEQFQCAILERLGAMSGELKRLADENARLSLKESQLRAIARLDVKFEQQDAELVALMADSCVESHVAEAVAAAPLRECPCPHIVVENLLPDALYDALIRGLPPAELFADRPVNKQQMSVPFDLAPVYSRRVWRFMARTIVDHMYMPAVLDKFREPIAAWLRQNFPLVPPELLASLPMTSSDGRILLRTRGYHIRPHRDPKWGLLTSLLYLARPGDSEHWGTQLFSVEADGDAPTVSPHWIGAERCRLVTDVPFRRNTLLAFLNSTGAHGARIPDDAPADLKRCVYQFRIGPNAAAIRELLATLPPDRRVAWAGKVVEYS